MAAVSGNGDRDKKLISFEELVGRIYEAATEPDAWPSVLHDIGRSVDAVGAALAAARSDKWVGWRCSPGTPPEFISYLRSDAPTRSQITTRLVQANRAGFVPDQDVLTEDAWLADPMMAEYAIPGRPAPRRGHRHSRAEWRFGRRSPASAEGFAHV